MGGRAGVFRPRVRRHGLALDRSGGALLEGSHVASSGGHLAFGSTWHAFPPGFDPFFTDILEVYDSIGERRSMTKARVGSSPSWEGAWPPPLPEEVPDDAAEVRASGLFEDVKVRRYLWEQTYSAEEYIGLLNTFSHHIAMEAPKREHLYREIRERMGRRPERRVRRHWYANLHVAARRIQPS